MGVCKGGAVHCSSKMGRDASLSLPHILPFIAGYVLNEIGVSELSDRRAEVLQVYVLMLVTYSLFWAKAR